MSRHLKYMIVIEEGPESFGAHVPDLPGCIAAGETRDEAIALIREAIELHLQDLQSQGLEIPEPSSSGEFVEVVAA
jgi:predicted RNase H-like HicB family nuclease